MLSSFTKSLTRKSRPDTSSPVRSIRTITFPEHTNEPPSSYRANFFQNRPISERPYSRNIDEHGEDDQSEEEDESGEEHEDVDEEAISSGSNEDETEEDTPLLPLFSSTHLNTLPVFTLTHAFREKVLERCDTVLTWEQLRSPQVSQFLIKPIQQEIRDNHMSAAVVSALLANCLQFTKEANVHPGNSGTNRTRALICELIAIKLLREYSTRELIDALSYDFDPLQGQPQLERTNGFQQAKKPLHRARISCIEIAIRAGSKRFLAHPLVIQHLEAIWNGSIVFHSAADSMHRRKPSTLSTSYGTTGQSQPGARPGSPSNKEVTLYNPRDASLFKLSRLRVPRYRNILSTISFAVLLVLFLSVLKERCLEITTLEVVFWTWAAGYMLDEVIGFNEQGFGLYIASFWNTFDVGILLLLFVHLCLRLYGVFAPLDDVSRIRMAHRSYDVLALSAILVFPRLFSVLDHYRYFSQLIIAFRMMASDMLAIFFLILIFCSGFLVALTFAFGYDTVDDPQAVAYALLQMLLGFTPAAWDRWGDYNWMGKFVLTLFLFVCHFVVVTILITVLTNSFMEIVRNANEEHQYLFAINTISNVKSDALFAYVPPLNVLQWFLTPLRYVLPFREYIKLNRTVIKATHFPILFAIFLYEKLVLQPQYVDTIDLVESRGRVKKNLSEAIPRMMRKPSMATVRQEAALEEVFRQRADTTLRTITSQERRKSSNVVNHWMQNVDDDADPPQEQDPKIVDKLEKRRRFGTKRLATFQSRDFSVTRRPTSIASDPNDFTSHAGFLSPRGRTEQIVDLTPSAIVMPSQSTELDSDENLQKDESHLTEFAPNSDAIRKSHQSDYFSSTRPSVTASPKPEKHDYLVPQDADHDHEDSLQSPHRIGHRPKHNRIVSSATMIYNPPADCGPEDHPSIRPEADSTYLDVHPSELQTSSSKPGSTPSGHRTPKRSQKEKPRPIFPTKNNQAFKSVPDFGNLISKTRPVERHDDLPEKDRRRSLEMDLVSDIGDNKAIGGGYVGAIPASFATRMGFANDATRQSKLQEQKEQQRDAEMFGRLMMARMNSLEEGFREVVHEVREGMRQVGSGVPSRQRSPARSEQLSSPRKVKGFRDRLERSRGALGSGTASVASDEKDIDRLPTNDNAGEEQTSPNKGGPVQLLEVPERKEENLPDRSESNKQDSSH